MSHPPRTTDWEVKEELLEFGITGQVVRMPPCSGERD